MKKTKYSVYAVLSVVTGVLISSITSASASTISWGGAFSVTHYAADGSDLETGTGPSSVAFALGVFINDDGSEFTPTFDNAEQWEDRWQPFVRNDGLDGPTTSTPGLSEYNPATGYFGGTVEIGTAPEQTDNTPFTVGLQVYVWGYSSQTYTEGMADPPEWLLYTGASGGSVPSDTNWLVPDDSAAGNDVFPYVWEVATADTAVFGRISDRPDGEGELTPPTSPLGEDGTQFAVVPEPSSLLLLLSSASILLLRFRVSDEK